MNRGLQSAAGFGCAATDSSFSWWDCCVRSAAVVPWDVAEDAGTCTAGRCADSDPANISHGEVLCRPSHGTGGWDFVQSLSAPTNIRDSSTASASLPTFSLSLVHIHQQWRQKQKWGHAKNFPVGIRYGETVILFRNINRNHAFMTPTQFQQNLTPSPPVHMRPHYPLPSLTSLLWTNFNSVRQKELALVKKTKSPMQTMLFMSLNEGIVNCLYKKWCLGFFSNCLSLLLAH